MSLFTRTWFVVGMVPDTLSTSPCFASQPTMRTFRRILGKGHPNDRSVLRYKGRSFMWDGKNNKAKQVDPSTVERYSMRLPRSSSSSSSSRRKSRPEEWFDHGKLKLTPKASDHYKHATALLDAHRVLTSKSNDSDATGTCYTADQLGANPQDYTPLSTYKTLLRFGITPAHRYRVAWIGCGLGVEATYMAAAFPNTCFYCVDINQPCITAAQNRRETLRKEVAASIANRMAFRRSDILERSSLKARDGAFVPNVVWCTTPVNPVVGHTLRLALELRRPVHVCFLTTQFAYALIGFPVSKSGRNKGSGAVPTGKMTRFFKDHGISYHLGSTLQYKAGTTVSICHAFIRTPAQIDAMLEKLDALA